MDTTSSEDHQFDSSNVSLDERYRAFNLCKKFLQGCWANLNSESDILVTKLYGGMTNLLYRCSLIDAIPSLDDEPRDILLRLYGPSGVDTEDQLEIFRQLAEERLGPCLYTTFKGGRFEQYLPSNPLSWQELTSPDISKIVARKIAAVHRLKVKCLPKEPNWLINFYNDHIDFIENLKGKPIKFKHETSQKTKLIATELMKINFKAEVDILGDLFERSNAPLVFSHNDLHQNNILLMEENEFSLDLNDRIVLIDFEYCSYNYRPFDIANHLCEWTINYRGTEYPFFTTSLDNFPSKDRQEEFLRHYVDAMDGEPLFGGDKADESLISENEKVDRLYQQLQPFLMASNFLWAVWAIKSACTSDINFGYWEMAKWKWGLYLLCKRKLVQN